MTQPEILLERRGDGVAVLTLNRPHRLNAFNEAMVDLWHHRLAEAIDDDTVRVVVITGAGRAFCTGGDAEETFKLTGSDGFARKNYLWEHIHKIALAIDETDKPVIAAVNGPARGAGCDMASMCDMRIAAASADFAESYINLGVIAGDGGAYFLPRLIGTARALEMFWTGRVVNAQEAERIGLVSQVVPDTDLMSVTLELAQRIAAQPQAAVRMYRRTVYQSANLPLRTHLDMVSSHMSLLMDTGEHRRALDRFRRRKTSEDAPTSEKKAKSLNE